MSVSDWGTLGLMIFGISGRHPAAQDVNSVKLCCSKEKIVLAGEYFRYFQKVNTIVFTYLSAIKRAKYHLSSTNIGGFGLFAYVIYSGVDKQCQQCASLEE